jgi:hypothetical protein
VPRQSRQLGPRATAAAIAGLGFAIALAGDATHVASGTTHYDWDGVPTLWRSAIWFPFLVAAAVLAAAWIAERVNMPAARRRTRADIPAGAGLVLALYALTAVVHDEPTTVSVTLTGALAIAIWSWWDPSPGSLLIAISAAVLGPLAEIGIVETGASSYASNADDLGGVAPWLPCLYFAAGAVAARLWGAVSGDEPDIS